jgi:hypothetical protein
MAYSAQITALSSSFIYSPSGWILTSRKSRMSGRCFKCCSGTVVRRATTCIPALIPASIPGRVSSKTRHSLGATPNRSAACRKPSGCGLPLQISSTGTITFGSGIPAAKTRASASLLHAEVTIAHEWFGAHSQFAWPRAQPEFLQAMSPRNDPFLPVPRYGLALARSAP